MKLDFLFTEDWGQLLNELQVRYHEAMYRAGFDTNLPIKWTHTFADKEPKKLQKLLDTLKESGYSLERLGKKDGKWILEVSKIDIISIDNECQKRLRFVQLTNFFDVQYKGRRAENIPTNH